MTRWISNEVDNETAYVATEAVTGVFQTPTYQLMGVLDIQKTQDLIENDERTGGYFRDQVPKLGVPSFNGTYTEDLTYETLPLHLQWLLKAGGAGVGDAGAPLGYTRTQAPSFAVDDIASFSAVYGINGLLWQSIGVRHNQATITIDVDDADGQWKWDSQLIAKTKTGYDMITDVATGGTGTTIVRTGAGWAVNVHAGKFVFLMFPNQAEQVRKIVSNTTDTLTVDEAFSPVPVAANPFRIEGKPPAISAPTLEAIASYGTKVFMDPYSGGTIGTTEIVDRVSSISFTVMINRTSKRFLNNARDTVAAKTGRGAFKVTGQFQVELDRRSEYHKWENLIQSKIRISQLGSVINASGQPNKKAQIDFPWVAFGTPTLGSRENNRTLIVPFRGFGTATPISVDTKNTVAALA